MTRPELIEVLSFVPGFTTDMLSGLTNERLVELYSDYFEGQEMNEILNAIFLGIGIGVTTGTIVALVYCYIVSKVMK